MKFLFTAPRFHTNQAPIVRGLIERGHEVRYFVIYVGATEDHSSCEPLMLKPSKTTIREKKKLAKTKTASEVESAISGRFIPDREYLKKQLLAYRPDVVICRDRTNLTLIVHRICAENGIACVLYDQAPVYPSGLNENHGGTTINNTAEPLLRRILNRMRRNANPDYRFIKQCKESFGFPKTRMSPVKYMVNHFLSELPSKPEHSYYIPLVYESDAKGSNRLTVSGNAVRFLCVAKFREYKNLPLLVRAFAGVETEDSWQLQIVGQAVNDDETAYRAKLLELIRECGLETRITLISNVEYHDMPTVYQSNDLLILPSRRETYGMAIVEAMANGLSVIASDSCGAAFCVKEAGGTVVRVNDVEDLTGALSNALRNRRALAELGNKAKDYIVKNQSFESYYQSLGKMLADEFQMRLF